MKKLSLSIVSSIMLTSSLMAYDSLSTVSPFNYAKNTFQFDFNYNKSHAEGVDVANTSSWGITTGVKMPIVTEGYKDYEIFWRWKIEYQNLSGKQDINGNLVEGDTNFLKGAVVLGVSKNLTYGFFALETGLLYDYEFRADEEDTEIEEAIPVNTTSQFGTYFSVGYSFNLNKKWQIGYEFENSIYFDDSYDSGVSYRYDNNLILTYRSANEFHIDYAIKHYRYSTRDADNFQFMVGLNWSWLD